MIPLVNDQAAANYKLTLDVCKQAKSVECDSGGDVPVDEMILDTDQIYIFIYVYRNICHVL